MKNLRLLTLVIVLFGCEGNKTVEESTPAGFADLPAGAIQESYPDNDHMVRATVYGTDRVVLQQGDYVDGIRQGVWTEFHPNGFVKQVVGYVNGNKQGQQLELDNRGQLLVRSTYYQGELHGDYVKYNRTRIKEKKSYDKGKQNGQNEIFYANGTVMEQSNYVDGQMDGPAKWFDQEGNVTIEYLYKNGELIKDE